MPARRRAPRAESQAALRIIKQEGSRRRHSKSPSFRTLPVLPDSEIGEVLLQCAIYCGVPAANGAFAIAQSVFDELDAEAAG